jgi:hypothetical protein
MDIGPSSDGLGRGTPSVRASWTGSSSSPTDWIGQAYLSVGRPTRISAHTKISDWAANPRVGPRIMSDGLAWVVKSCPSPSPGLARVPWPRTGFWVLLGRVEKKCPNPTRRPHYDQSTARCLDSENWLPISWARVKIEKKLFWYENFQIVRSGSETGFFIHQVPKSGYFSISPHTRWIARCPGSEIMIGCGVGGVRVVYVTEW